MYVDTSVLHDVLGRIMGQSEFVSMCFNPTQCDLHALFQYISKLPCQLNAATTRHVCNLNEQNTSIASGGISHETRNDTWTTVTLLVSGPFVIWFGHLKFSSR